MNKFLLAVRDRMGFLTSDDTRFLLGEHSEQTRLLPILVRCGGTRFTCGLQYLDTMIDMVEKSGDYVRDVSIPANSREWTRFGYTHP